MNWSMGFSEQAALATRAILKTTGPVPVDSRR